MSRKMNRDEILQTIIDQGRETREIRDVEITCGGCAEKQPLRRQFRCFHCHVWYCARCARGHFGPEFGEEDTSRDDRN